MAPMPNARSENCPLMKYMAVSPTIAPKATGRSSRGRVFQFLKQIKINISTSINDPMMVPVRSDLIIVEL